MSVLEGRLLMLLVLDDDVHAVLWVRLDWISLMINIQRLWYLGNISEWNVQFQFCLWILQAIFFFIR